MVPLSAGLPDADGDPPAEAEGEAAVDGAALADGLTFPPDEHAPANATVTSSAAPRTYLRFCMGPLSGCKEPAPIELDGPSVAERRRPALPD
jgi:hypothetical protein